MPAQPPPLLAEAVTPVATARLASEGSVESPVTYQIVLPPGARLLVTCDEGRVLVANKLGMMTAERGEAPRRLPAAMLLRSRGIDEEHLVYEHDFDLTEGEMIPRAARLVRLGHARLKVAIDPYAAGAVGVPRYVSDYTGIAGDTRVASHLLFRQPGRDSVVVALENLEEVPSEGWLKEP